MTTEPLKKLLPGKLDFIDVGGRGGIEQPWAAIEDLISVAVFEPDPEEYDRLSAAAAGTSKRVFPQALWSFEGEIPIFLTKSRGCSSLYRPNRSFLDAFPNSERFEVEESCTIQTSTLSSISRRGELENIDFLKVDVQGGELDVLRGALEVEGIVGMQLEVEFQPMYEEQPLFPEIDQFVRKEFKMELHDLRKTYWKYSEGRGVGSGKGKLIFGDALYFVAPESLVEWCRKQPEEIRRKKLSMAVLMGIVYGCFDYSLHLLKHEAVLEIFGRKVSSQWCDYINHIGGGVRFQGRVSNKISAFLRIIAGSIRPSHEGWAVTGEHLGSRKRFGVHY